MPAGYSQTPLAKKLGLKENFRILLYKEPAHYQTRFTDFPSGTVTLKQKRAESADFIHVFCTTMKELVKISSAYKAALKKNGTLWVSWPKGKSSIPTGLNGNTVREYMLGIGLVDVKVAAIDEDWSALKFVYRLTDR